MLFTSLALGRRDSPSSPMSLRLASDRLVAAHTIALARAVPKSGHPGLSEHLGKEQRALRARRPPEPRKSPGTNPPTGRRILCFDGPRRASGAGLGIQAVCAFRNIGALPSSRLPGSAGPRLQVSHGSSNGLARSISSWILAASHPFDAR
jgi:hypothetical protein